MTFRDATEYQFATPTRRVLVREARAGTEPVGLEEAGRRYAATLRDVLDATEATTGPVATSAGGAEFVVVTATVPQADTGGEGAGRARRVAAVRRGTDRRAEPHRRPGRRRGRGRVPPAGRPRPAGRADRPGRRGRPRALEGRTVAGPDRSRPSRSGSRAPTTTPPTAVPARLGRRRPPLPRRGGPRRPRRSPARCRRRHDPRRRASGVARAEDGRPVRYETGVRPRLSPGRRTRRRPRGPGHPPRSPAEGGPAAPGDVVAEGTVGTTRVRVRVAPAAGGAAPAADLGEQLIRALDASRGTDTDDKGPTARP